jgi:hypothetical protein
VTDLNRKQKKKSKSKWPDLKKLKFSTPPSVNIFFAKISGIGPWVSRIN